MRFRPQCIAILLLFNFAIQYIKKNIIFATNKPTIANLKIASKIFKFAVLNKLFRALKEPENAKVIEAKMLKTVTVKAITLSFDCCIFFIGII